MTSSAVLVVLALALFGAGAALAASGTGTLVTGGEDSAVNGRAAQQPLGDISATPNNVTGQGNQGANTNGQTPSSTGSTPLSGTQRAAATSVGSAGQTGSQLPFTGFLAMSVLLAGVALLLVGFAMRRVPRRI